MNERSPQFTEYCAMTCLGGSEKKTCPCLHPRDCELQQDPYYAAARNAAKARMARYLRNGIADEDLANVLADVVKGP